MLRCFEVVGDAFEFVEVEVFDFEGGDGLRFGEVVAERLLGAAAVREDFVEAVGGGLWVEDGFLALDVVHGDVAEDANG